MKLALNLRRHYLYGLVYDWVHPPLVQLHSGGTPYWRSAYQWKFDPSDGLECDVVVRYLAPLVNVPQCRKSMETAHIISWHVVSAKLLSSHQSGHYVQGVSEHQDKNKGKKAVLLEFQILK